ncbi:hypothetical protein BT96DRAFT_994656 [Gymnopus androsaceus JB14]|uniref:F-box domain-containing protein n=1 Tax=Gymnopus androsaceus JB14 TaxID=1447944 RepID=A0A6A4HKR5_9AGAR|nr:hypothetical protein BT96DRAFT_994656 [Gymnopus androsaceus JB14]
MDAYLKTARHLDALFSEKPYLASYVWSLELQSFRRYKVPMPKVVYTATASLVQRLSEVKELKFHYFEWNTLPPLLKAVLTELCKAPSVTQFSATEFDITTFTELASLLSNMKNLKVLDVNVAYRNGTVPRLLPKSETKPQCIQLSDLRLIGGYSHGNSVRPLMTWFQQDWCPFEVRHLNSLEITTWVNMVTLQYCCTNLQELKLIEHRNGESMHVQTTNYMLSLQLTTLVGLDHLGYTPNLRSLSLMSLISNFRPSLYNPTTWIQSLFKPLLNPDGNPSHLQHLTISLPIRIRPLQSDPLSLHHWEPWTAIDVLLGKPEFALLETVDFKLNAPLGFPEIPNGARQLLRGKLPFLETSGKLRVQMVNN